MNLFARVAAVEFMGDCVRLAVVKTGLRAPAVREVHFARAVYEGPEGRFDALVEAVQEVVGMVKSRPDAYVLCGSCEISVVRSLSVLPRVARQGAAAIQFELEPYLAFPIEELVVDCAKIRDVDGETEVLAVGMRRGPLEEQVAVLQAAGIDLEGIGVDAVGLTSLWFSQTKSKPGLRAVVHVRENGAVLAVVYKKSLAYFRHLPLTADGFDSDPAGAAREVQNSLRAFLAAWQGGDEFTDLTVTGLDPGSVAAGKFQDHSQLTVQYHNLLLPVRKAAAVIPEGDEPAARRAWAGVVSVGIAAAGGAFPFDFRRGELAPRNTLRLLFANAGLSLCLTLLVALGYGAFCYMDYRSNVAQIDQIGADVWKLYVEAFPQSEFVVQGRHPQDVGGGMSLQFMETDVGKAASLGEILPVDMLGRPTLLAILHELNARMPGDKVTITELKIRSSETGSQVLTVSGKILDEAAFRGIFDSLKQSELLTFDDEAFTSIKQGEATFTLTATT